MARKRFSDVKRGAELGAAQTAYFARLSNPTRSNPNSRGARAPRQLVAIVPYGFGASLDDKVLSSRPLTQSFTPAGLFTAANRAEVSTNVAGAVKVRGFLPAQITLQQGSRNVEVETSRFTNLRYLKYNGLQKYTSPFGRATLTDLEFDARNLLRIQFLTGNNSVIKRVSFRNEARTEYQ